TVHGPVERHVHGQRRDEVDHYVVVNLGVELRVVSPGAEIEGAIERRLEPDFLAELRPVGLGDVEAGEAVRAAELRVAEDACGPQRRAGGPRRQGADVAAV